jgi:hypothetical protein
MKTIPLELERVLSPAPGGAVIGRLAGTDATGRPLVRLDEHDPVASPALVLSTAAAEILAAEPGAAVLAVIPGGKNATPVILGLVAGSPARAAAPVPAPASVRLGRGRREARLDGQQVVLEAEREIVLKCGRSSLTLRRDGEVVLRGVRVLSRAAQTNRIRGASVQIN